MKRGLEDIWSECFFWVIGSVDFILGIIRLILKLEYMGG